MSKYLFRYYGTKPIILLDAYDTPLQEAWVHNYWDKLVSFLRGFFLSTFKTNQYLERGLICGIIRVDSDLGNFKVVSCTSNLYADCFGFTEQEVFDVMDEDALTNRQEVKKYYGIVIEFKTTPKKDSLDKTSDRALKQIYEKGI